MLKPSLIEDKIYCEICPIRDRGCISLCNDMKNLLEDKKARRIEFSEIPTDPLVIDQLNPPNSLWKVIFEDMDLSHFKNVKTLIMAHICDYIEYNLSKGQKEVIVMYFWGGYTEKKIGTIVGSSQVDAHKKLSRGIQNIKNYLKEYKIL